jgi:poly(hydroxyalkanoate) depolymerase family esterase
MRRTWTSIWAKGMRRSLAALRKAAQPARKRASARKAKSAAPAPAPRRAAALSPAGASDNQSAGRWSAGVALGPAGARRYKLYRPPGLRPGERVPMIVMLHGCGQDAEGFAASTRMNPIAARERFVVLYPEQDRLANPQRCWNWFDTKSGRAYREAALIMAAVEQACLLYPVDRQSVAVAGLSAGASMAALLVTRYPDRFKAVVMHSGVPPGTAHSGLTALHAMHGRRATSPLQATPSARAAPWPPLLVIHGTADTVVDVRNGRVAAQVWADAAGAQAAAERGVQRGMRYAMNVTDFKHKGSTVATFAAVERLGHAWSGGAAKESFSDAKGPDASRMVWAFAARHFRK